MNRIFLPVLMLGLLWAVATSQSLNVVPYGISPRGVAADTTDIFDRAYNGLLNVGVETQMYLKGYSTGAKLNNPTWAVTGPEGSVAGITETVNLDTSTQVAVFTPDVTGTYVVEFSDGDQSASVTINAGTYMGIEDGNCSLCHAGKAEEWSHTGHSSMLERGLNGTLSDHYASYCISCHTTGYDLKANNNGFDDFPFTFPDELVPGMYDSMKTVYPEAMKRANIQCESCHGPGSAHFGNTSDSRMVATLDSKNCAWCHDSGTHHVFPAQWEVSQHANPKYASYAGSRAACAQCHSGAGFVNYVENGKQPLSEAPPVTAITCATCHDPHSDENPHQLRTVEVTLGNGLVVEGGGLGKLCMNCHKSRRDAKEYTGPNFRYSAHYGPHHGPQADMLIGTNAATFGKNLPSSAHFSALKDACVTCHMTEGHVDEEGNVILVGSHSFSMVSPDGQDNVKACEECHGNIGESFAEKKFFLNGVADHDGDGVEEGLQEEVEGLLEELALMLPPIDSSAVIVNDPYIYTQTEAKAAYNYFFVEEDRSKGIHNPAFAVSLLKISIQALKNHALNGEIVEIKDVPNDQGKKVRIIWNKFPDDGIAADPIASYTIKRFDGDSTVWTSVGEVTADGSPRYALEVPTLYDSTVNGLVLTTFKVAAISRGGNVYESQPAEGYSVDNLVPTAPGGFLASVIDNKVQLSWEESPDEDFNYFAVYRSMNSDFVPSDENLIATSTGTMYIDSQVEMEHTYFYKIAAFDFSGNKSEFSETSVVLTGVDSKNSSVPTDYSLAQNYPNPFNPSTLIRFGLPKVDKVRINIYDIRGVHIRTLADGNFAAGYHQLMWDGRDANGNLVSAGTYIYRLESSSRSIAKKMIFLK